MCGRYVGFVLRLRIGGNNTELREANDLLDEMKNLDSLIADVQSPERTLTVCTRFNEVKLKGEHKTKAIQVILGIRGELAKKLEELGVTEEYNDKKSGTI